MSLGLLAGASVGYHFAVVLDVRDLGKAYGNVVALQKLSFSVSEGEVFGLLGPNGAGKTTAISIIAGLQSPSHGTVTVAAQAHGDFDARKYIGLVPQQLAVYKELTARENLQFFASLYGLTGGAAREGIAWALEVAALVERADEPVHRYSGGMQRRLNIAAALVHKPALLMLDEPTVGIDPQSRKYIFDAIRALAAQGVAVLYTSHYMEEVEALCTRVAIMDSGEILAMDSVSALISTYGAVSVEVAFAGDSQAVAAATKGLLTVDGKRATGPMPERLGALLSCMEAAGATITSCEARAADLETVFLHLTGHSLRDD